MTTFRARPVRAAAALAFTSILCGCVGTEQYTSSIGGASGAASAAQGRARVRIERPSMPIGGLIPIAVYDGETKIGSLGPGGSIEWDRPAGSGKITTVSSNYWSWISIPLITWVLAPIAYPLGWHQNTQVTERAFRPGETHRMKAELHTEFSWNIYATPHRLTTISSG